MCYIEALRKQKERDPVCALREERLCRFFFFIILHSCNSHNIIHTVQHIRGAPGLTLVASLLFFFYLFFSVTISRIPVRDL